MLANQLGKPVDDHTALKGKYDINLNWTDDGSHAATHAPVAAPGGWSGGGGGHGDGGGSGGGYHGGGGSSGSPSASAGAAPDLTLIGAVQAQLGLVLKPKSATFKLLFVDAVDKAPTAN